MATGTKKKSTSQSSSGTRKRATAQKAGTSKAAPKKSAAVKKSSSGTRSKASTSRKEPASARSNTSPNTKGTAPAAAFLEENSESIGQEILIWVVAAAAVLVLISCFIPQGVAGSAVSAFFFGLFGIMAYIFPIAFFFGFAYYLRNRSRDPYTWRQLLGFACAFVFVCALVHLLFYDNFPVDSPIEYYRVSSEDRIGGGLTGGTLVFIFQLAFGVVGAYVLTIAGLAISVIMFTQKPFFTSLGITDEEARQRRLERDLARAEKRERDDRMRRLREEKRLEEERRILDEKRLAEDRRILDEKNRLAEEAAAMSRAQEPAEDTDEKALEEQRKIDISYMMHDRGTGRRSRRKAGGESAVPGFLREFTAKKEDKTSEGTEKQHAGNEGKGDSEVSAIIAEENIALADNVTAIFGEKAPVAEENVPESRDRNDAEELSILDAEKYAADEPPADDFLPDMTDEEMDAPAETPKRKRKNAARLSDKDLKKETDQVRKAVKAEKPVQVENSERGHSFMLYPGEKESYLPSLERLEPPVARAGDMRSETEDKKLKLAELFSSFNVDARVGNVSVGPTVTRYEIYPGIGVKVSKITGLQDDIKLKLATADIRIEAPIPGTNAIGIEVPNSTNVIVPLREILEDQAYIRAKSKLTFAVGKDLGGKAVVFNIAKMPHLLIAGATGSGKSVCINTVIMSILYKARPDEVKMLMIDPKMVELKVYDNLPHLLIPVVTDAKKAAGALNWAVQEMMGRYQKFSSFGVRDIAGYNAALLKKNAEIDEQNFIHGNDEGYKPKARLQKMPQIVIIVDELADLMMVAPKEVEESICRLAQLARAAGIHLIIATQRPSVNVITGLIKANMPSRIALAVSSNVDSRTIIDMNGAEKLLGNGDMLFYPQGYSKPVRVQGAFVRDEEISSVMEFYDAMSETGGTDTEEARQIEAAITSSVNNSGTSVAGQPAEQEDGRDEYFVKAGRFIIEKKKASIGMLQRNYKIGFNRAARIMDQLAEAGVVGPEEGTKPRKILMTVDEFDAAFGRGGMEPFDPVPDELSPFDDF